jgi:hypothetical protein
MPKKLPATARLAAPLLPLVLLGGPGAHAQAPEVPTTTCRPVTPVTLHRTTNACVATDFMGEPFIVNRRLAPIEDGTVPCVEVDTMEATRCVFDTGVRRFARVVGRASGPWLEDAEGHGWAVVGQPVTRDGSLSSGAYIVATVPDAEGTTPCVGASGRDAVSSAGSIEAMQTCVLEVAGSETNVAVVDGRPQPLVNWVDRYVGTTSVPHPDGAALTAYDPDLGLGWYTGTGAALNDTGGEERHRVLGPGGEAAWTEYIGKWWSCHFIDFMGYQVPAAKRPSTRTTPYPGSVNVQSRIRWLPVNPYVTIANSLPAEAPGVPPLFARFDFSLGLNTLWVDATASLGDIVQYRWDLDWTSRNPDAIVTSPTTSFPIAFEGVPPRHGRITLTVTSRIRLSDTTWDTVEFRSRLGPLPGRRLPDAFPVH